MSTYPQLYRHWKNGKAYLVTGKGLLTESDLLAIIYYPLYKVEDSESFIDRPFIREAFTQNGFFASVQDERTGGRRVKRFAEIDYEDLSLEEREHLEVIRLYFAKMANTLNPPTLHLRSIGSLDSASNLQPNTLVRQVCNALRSVE